MKPYYQVINFLFLLLFSSTSTLLYAQKEGIAGRVLDAETNEPLVGAALLVNQKGTTSDHEGNFTLDLDTGTYTIRCSYVGFEAIRKEVVIKKGQKLKMDFLLSPVATLLQTATVSSGKYEKALGEVVVSLEILEPQLIESVNATDVGQALNKVPGVDINDQQAEIRGGAGWAYGAGSRVLIMVDDIPAIQPDAGRPNWTDFPLENIDQIEVIKGASSALYGSTALAGLINIRTAYAKSEPVTKASVFYTSYMPPKIKEKKWWDSPRFETGLSASHSQKFKKLDLVVGAFGRYDLTPNKNTETRHFRFSSSLRYRIKDNVIAGLNANVNGGRGDDFFYWRGPLDNEEKENVGYGYYEGDTTSLSTTDRFRYYFDPHLTIFDKKGNKHRVIGRYYGIDNDATADRGTNSDLFYLEYQAHRKIEPLNATVTGGVVGMLVKAKAELYGDGTIFTLGNTAAFLQFEKKFFDRLNISGGFRIERFAVTGPDTVATGNRLDPGGKETEAKPVFRAGANLKVSDGTFFRASWGQGYRYPTLAEKYINTDAGSIRVIPNVNLKSETGWSAEVGVKQGMQVGKWSGFLDFAAFWSEYSDMMEFTVVNLLDLGIDPKSLGLVFPIAFQSQNIGDTKIKGFEASLAGRGSLYGIPLNLMAGYVFIDPRFKEFDTSQPEPGEKQTAGQKNANGSTSENNILKYRRQHSYKFDIEAQFDKFSVGVAGIFGSKMEAIDVFLSSLNGIGKYREENDRGFGIINARTGFRASKFVKFSLIAKNILNQEYTRRPGLMEPTRNITFRTDVKF